MCLPRPQTLQRTFSDGGATAIAETRQGTLSSPLVPSRKPLGTDGMTNPASWGHMTASVRE